jgi:opacity protein-like surface antigen
MTLRPLLCAAMLAMPLTANAGWYAGPLLMVGTTDEQEITDTSGLATSITDRNDNSMIIGASGLLGYDFSEDDLPFSVEFATSWRARHDLNIHYLDGTQQGVKSNVQTVDFMVSALYDIPLKTTLQPYVGGGIGMAYAHADSNYLLGPAITDIGTETTTNIAWQLQAGIKYPLADATNLRVDYRYIDLGEISLPTAPNGSQLDANLYSHDVRMGVTFDF